MAREEPLDEIKADLDADSARFKSLSSKQVAEAYAAGTSQVDREISSDDLLAWSATGPYARIKKGQQSSDDVVASMCHAAERLIDTPDPYKFDPNNPARIALVDNLVTAGVLTAADKVALLALGKESKREDVAKFGVKTTAGMIERARAK